MNSGLPVQINLLRHKLTKLKPAQVVSLFIAITFMVTFFKISASSSSPVSVGLLSSLNSTDSNLKHIISDDNVGTQQKVDLIGDSKSIGLQSQSYARENATILTLCRNEDLAEIARSVRRLEDRFNRNYHYDWVFLNNDEFNEEFKSVISGLVSGKAKFGLIPREHWSYPSYIDQNLAREEREKMAKKGVIYADSESYRHMCRFNSGFFYKHELLQEYKYYWRVEPDVQYFCDIPDDPFKFMRVNNKVYGFTISIHEFHVTIASMWGHIKEFLQQHKESIADDNLMDFISEDGGDTYNLCHFWSNFEIADMDFWRSDLYEAFFQHLDKTGGFFYERWGDAPIHSIAVALFLDRSKIHYFDHIGYNHGVYSMCPIDDGIRSKYNCLCNKDIDFTFKSYSCGQKYFGVTGLKKPDNWEKYADL